MGGFWSKIANRTTAWADLRLEHEVELDWWFWLNTGIWILHVVFCDELTELGAVVVVDFCKYLFIFFHDVVFELNCGCGSLDLSLLLALNLFLDVLDTSGILVALQP